MTVKHPRWSGLFIIPAGNWFGTTVRQPVIGLAAHVFICFAAISRSRSAPAVHGYKFFYEMPKSA
jgi:hypothetical protein